MRTHYEINNSSATTNNLSMNHTGIIKSGSHSIEGSVRIVISVSQNTKVKSFNITTFKAKARPNGDISSFNACV